LDLTIIYSQELHTSRSSEMYG